MRFARRPIDVCASRALSIKSDVAEETSPSGLYFHNSLKGPGILNTLEKNKAENQ